MVCPAVFINLANPVSIFGLGLIGFAIYNVITGKTYVKHRDHKTYISWYRELYFSEEPILFSIIVFFNFLIGCIIFGMINHISLLSLFK